MTQPDLSGSPRLRVVVIDDDSGFVQVLTKRVAALEWQHRVSGAALPPQTLVAMRVNALIVDLARLGPDPYDYLRSVSEGLPALAIVVCTGPSSVAQRVRGLRLGADDWVTKPCHPEEVIARVEAVLRRRRHADARAEAEAIVTGELEIRSDQFQAFVSGTSVELTRREFELLRLLARAEGQVLERERIYQRVWGYEMAHGDRSVDVFVRKLRHKLQKVSPGWDYIHTHFGVGYRFAPTPAAIEGPEPAERVVRSDDVALAPEQAAAA